MKREIYPGTYVGVNYDGSTFDANPLANCSQAEIIDKHPDVHHIRHSASYDMILWRRVTKDNSFEVNF